MTQKNNFKYRKAQQNAWCRCCDKEIVRGEYMVTGYSSANRGMNMHFHPECIKAMAELIQEGSDEVLHSPA